MQMVTLEKKSFSHVLREQVGTTKNTGDSVQEVRAIRQKLSKERFDLKKINSL